VVFVFVLVVIQYSTSCHKWVHVKCSGIKGSMYKVMKTFICKGCMNPVTSTGRTSVDIGVNAILELVGKFCYLGGKLSVDGDAKGHDYKLLYLRLNVRKHFFCKRVVQTCPYME